MTYRPTCSLSYAAQQPMPETVPCGTRVSVLIRGAHVKYGRIAAFEAHDCLFILFDDGTCGTWPRHFVRLEVARG